MKEVDFMEQHIAPAYPLRAKVGKNKDVANAPRHFAKCKAAGPIPCRTAPKWTQSAPATIDAKRYLEDVAVGKLPLGLIPAGVLLPGDNYRKEVVQQLQAISTAKYDNTSNEQRVESWGKPFVDSATLDDYFQLEVNPTVLAISNPFVTRTYRFLESLGFQVDYLTDPTTGAKYHAGVLRKISVSKTSSVLHVDDFIRDGLKKPDFRLPSVLKGERYFQLSFNLLLEDGSHQADPLYCYNKFYNPCDEKQCMDNGWQFPESLVAGCDYHKHQPKVGGAYVFSTTAYHDIYGGSPLADRITWSVFAIYIPAKNLMLLYN